MIILFISLEHVTRTPTNGSAVLLSCVSVCITWPVYCTAIVGSSGHVIRTYILINVELTSTFLLYRGLVHHHHRILKVYLTYIRFGIILTQVYVNFSRKLDRSLIGIVQLLRFSDFSLNPLSFFLYGPFNLTDNYNI